jgi:bacillithiol biosynthesis cysteine-adding enzyme BshC
MTSADTPACTVQHLSYRETARFSGLVNDYLEGGSAGGSALRALWPFAPSAEGLDAAVAAIDAFAHPREALRRTLEAQYEGLPEQPAVREGIEALGDDGLAVVTAHQLNLFTGPLYVILKTVSAIRLARQLAERHPGRRFVPVFWLGTEDHDFAEINHFHLFGRRLAWERDAGGPCGRLDLGGLDAVYAELDGMLRDDEHAESLRALFREAYDGPGTLAQAQRRLLHRLFGRFGLVVLDADTPALKRPFAALAERELREGFAAAHGGEARRLLAERWHLQAEPRPLNLFRTEPGRRERLDRDGDGVMGADTGRRWTVDELVDEVRAHPERFSPNVVLRPLHQQAVLPAVAFLGGGGELAYWLPLAESFRAAGVFAPVLLLRNSAWWLDRPSAERLEALDLDPARLFGDPERVVQDWVRAHESADLSLATERAELEAFYGRIAERAAAVDPSLVGTVEAEMAGQAKALEKLEQRLVKAAKQRHDTQVNQLRKLFERHFPGGGLQERHDNMAALWLRHGEAFLDALMDTLDPLDPRFTILREDA